MRRRYGYYCTKLVGGVVLLTAWTAGFLWIGASWWQLGSAVVLSVLLTQIAFLGHDAAHRQIFVSGRWNDWASLVVANLLVGLSYGWWQTKHTRHHATPNQDGSDPDIDLPALAFTPAQAARPRPRLLAWLVARQGCTSSRCCSSRGFRCTRTAWPACWAVLRSSGGGSSSPS